MITGDGDAKYEFHSPNWSKVLTAGMIVLLLVLVVLGVAILLPSRGRMGLSSRGMCAANLRGIAQSMEVYAADNSDKFPIVPFSPYASSSNAVKGVSTGTTDGDAAMRQMYVDSSRQAGSVQACMWVLALGGQVSPKQFVCKSDPYASGAAPTTDNAGNYLNNFQEPTMLSYSMAYPWDADGKPGPWWTSTGDATLPLLADMNPRQGTGKPARNMTAGAAPKDPRTWNSANHEGDGQNVAYADAHAEFQRHPDVGQDNDNIYTMSGSSSFGPAQLGGIQAGAPNLTAKTRPFDIIMLPVRDETTGRM